MNTSPTPLKPSDDLALNPYFQVGVDVLEQLCLVIGGNLEASEKTGRLLGAGARIVVVSPKIEEQLQTWKADGRIEHRQRAFKPGDIAGAFLIVNSVAGNEELSRQVYELAKTQRCLINTYDQPQYSNFGMAALVSPGHLRLSISTSNASPSVARRLREDLERIFNDGEFEEYLNQLGRVREHLKSTVPDSPRRIELLRSLVVDFGLEGRLRLPRKWRTRVASLMGEFPVEHRSNKKTSHTAA